MKICEAGRSSGCCRNPDIRTINTMGADTAGNFEIRAGNSVSITTETNGIRIAYTGGITVYTNTDGNIVIDNDLFTIDLADDLAITGNAAIGGDLGVTGDAVISGDLTVNGTYYTVHAEHVYTQDDYIIMRNGAVTGLGSGQYSGFQVKLYDGVNDGRLVIDNSGTARVGDVGDEQPLLTRDESADLTDGDSLIWDAANSKAVTAAIPSAISTALSGKQDTLAIETFSMTAGTNVTIDYQNCWAYGKLVHIDADIRYTANLAGGTQLVTIPNAYLPVVNIGMMLYKLGASPNIHPAGIGWGRNGIFSDTAIDSTEQTRVSITYYRN